MQRSIWRRYVFPEIFLWSVVEEMFLQEPNLSGGSPDEISPHRYALRDVTDICFFKRAKELSWCRKIARFVKQSIYYFILTLHLFFPSASRRWKPVGVPSETNISDGVFLPPSGISRQSQSLTDHFRPTKIRTKRMADCHWMRCNTRVYRKMSLFCIITTLLRELKLNWKRYLRYISVPAVLGATYLKDAVLRSL